MTSAFDEEMDEADEEAAESNAADFSTQGIVVPSPDGSTAGYIDHAE